MMRRVAVFGATGAMGSCALDLVQLHPDRYRASVLAAYRDIETLAAKCVQHRPDLAVIADPSLEKALARRLAGVGVHCEVASGSEAWVQAAAFTLCDIVVVAITGIPGADVALAAANAGKRVLLTHHDPAVMAGPLLRQALLAKGTGELIPVDSGLLAAIQCLSTRSRADGPIERLTLSGSGGPFAGRRRPELMTVTPEQLCNPSDRGSRRKIAVDSATLMDRGLQLIAAHQLFQLPPERIDLVTHPQHEVHARAVFADGIVQAQAGPVDQHQALTLALDGLQASQPNVDSGMLSDFEKPDSATFRCLALARQALQAGGDAPTILNAANGVAVEAFLAGSWPFLSIADLIEQVLMELPPQAVVDIQTLSERDRAAREAARRVLRNAC
jgi:1-deoxy-D-xylulose-5-phosphate reductoisomerase